MCTFPSRWFSFLFVSFLQDIRSTLQRCEQKEHLENPVAFPPELKRKLQERCDIGPFLWHVMKQFQDTLVPALQMRKANVTLDPTTACHTLILSEDRRSIKYRRDTEDLPLGYYLYAVVPEKNYSFGSVLGCEEFTGGCHFWEVSVGSEEGWALGVAKKSVRDPTTLTPENKIWAVGRSWGQYKASIKGLYPPLSLSRELKRIRVWLNYKGGQVVFLDPDTGTLLYSFSGVPFFGQTLCPFFAVRNKGLLRLSS